MKSLNHWQQQKKKWKEQKSLLNCKVKVSTAFSFFSPFDRTNNIFFLYDKERKYYRIKSVKEKLVLFFLTMKHYHNGGALEKENNQNWIRKWNKYHH